jgi:hypothetical protein
MYIIVLLALHHALIVAHTAPFPAQTTALGIVINSITTGAEFPFFLAHAVHEYRHLFMFPCNSCARLKIGIGVGIRVAVRIRVGSSIRVVLTHGYRFQHPVTSEKKHRAEDRNHNEHSQEIKVDYTIHY